MVWRKVKLDKKPAVKAKAARRGRPKGSKNKPKGLEKQIANWDAEPRTPAVNFKELAQKLQNALAKSYVEVQQLEKANNIQAMHLSIKQKRIEHLEQMVAVAVECGSFDLGDDEDSAV